MRKYLVFMILGVLTVFLFGQVALPREETLYVVAQLGGPATTWNLYSAQTTWGTEQILYIPAFLYDPGKDAWLPLLAEGYHFVDGKTIRIKIRNEAKWSDGVPITAQDFVYTFELTKKLGIGPGVGWNDYIEYVKAVDNKVVEFRARADNLNYYQLLSYALGAKPVPKHVYEKLEAQGVNIRDWVNGDPKTQVVSGPYKLFYHDPSIVAYERIDDWWGKTVFGLPRPKYLANTFYKDNPVATLALEQGDVDCAGLFIPAVSELWEKKKLPIRTWYKNEPYFLVEGIILLYMNNLKPILNNPIVKRAVAHAIPYSDMVKKAFFGYSVQAHPSLVIDLFEPNKQYIDYELARRTWKTPDGRIPVDLSLANKILDEAGFKRGRDGIRVAPDGTRLGPYTISVPYGWTDWMMMCEIIAKNLKEIGIEVVTEFPDFSVWVDRLMKGTYEIIIAWTSGVGFDHPFNSYRFALDKRLVDESGMTTWAGGWARYDNDEVVKLLDSAVSTLDPEVRKKAYFRIQEIIYRDMPVIPLFYGTHWYEYSERYWINWPAEENPYWSRPRPSHPDSLPVYFGVSPKNRPQPIPSWLETIDKGGYLIPSAKIFSDLQSAAK